MDGPQSGAIEMSRTSDQADGARIGSLPGPSGAEADQLSRTRQMLSICIPAVTASMALYSLYFYLQNSWQLLVVAGGAGLALLGLGLSLLLTYRQYPRGAAQVLLLSLLLVLGMVPLCIEGLTLYIVASAALLIALVGMNTLPGGGYFWAGALAAFGLYAWLVDWWVPLPRYIPVLPGIPALYLLGASFVPLVIVLWHVTLIPLRALASIRARLLITALLLVVFTGGAISYFSTIVLMQAEQREAADRLNLVATRKEGQVDEWTSRMKEALVLFGRSARPQLTTVLAGHSTNQPAYAEAMAHLRADLTDTFVQIHMFDAIYVLDTGGSMIASVGAASAGQPLVDAECIRQALQDACLQPPRYYPSLGRFAVVSASPTSDQQGHVVGIIAGYAGLDALDRIATQTSSLGSTGAAYMIGADGGVLTSLRTVQPPGSSAVQLTTIRSQGTETVINGQTNGWAFYEDYRRVPVVGAYRWLPGLQIGLLAEQDQAEAFKESAMLTEVHLGITLVLLAAAALMALYMVRSITAPISRLAETAAQIAEGSLYVKAPVEQNDEIGALAQGFNKMTTRLRQAMDQLQQRTEELSRANSGLQLENAERKSAEQALELERNKLKGILDAMDDGVYIVNRQYSIEYTNPALRREFGTPGDRKCFAYLYGRGEPCPWCPNEKVWQGLSVRREQEFEAGKWYELFDTPLRNSDGTLAKLALFHDVTGRKLAEEQILQRNRELATLSRRLVEVQESERHYISRELHDETGQALTSLMLRLGILERDLQRGAPVTNRMSELKNTVQEVLQGLHNLAVDLRPPSLDHVGLVPALRQYAERMTQEHGLVVDFGAIGLDEERLPPEMEVIIYRIVQEAVVNVVRHAHATHADVVVERRSGLVRIIIEDNGRGFDPSVAAESGRLGLIGMRERVEMLGGHLVIEGAPGAGTTIIAEAPYNDSHPDRG